jgi:1-acyl-sn-glycerol-3-phosphate acyltransferase
MSVTRPTLFVCNHTSYIDIEALGAVVPGCFVAKSEVAGWPGFGLLAKLQRTIFVERRAQRTAGQRDVMAERLAAGDNLMLFAEGTSNDGNRVLPFKSALFSVAEQPINGSPVTVQPVSIAYTRLDGMPLMRHMRPLFAWYGDMELAGHLWTLLGTGDITVVIEFHSPVTMDQFGSRKALATHCHQVIAAGVSAAIHGRA